MRNSRSTLKLYKLAGNGAAVQIGLAQLGWKIRRYVN